MEEYYRDEYPKIMRRKVYAILPGDEKRLALLFDICTRDESAWKRSVKVPDVVAVERAWRELEESYPEFRFWSYNRQIAREQQMLCDDAGFDYNEEIGNLTERVLEAARERKAKIQGNRGF